MRITTAVSLLLALSRLSDASTHSRRHDQYYFFAVNRGDESKKNMLALIFILGFGSNKVCGESPYLWKIFVEESSWATTTEKSSSRLGKMGKCWWMKRYHITPLALEKLIVIPQSCCSWRRGCRRSHILQGPHGIQHTTTTTSVSCPQPLPFSIFVRPMFRLSFALLPPLTSSTIFFCGAEKSFFLVIHPLDRAFIYLVVPVKRLCPSITSPT